MIVEHRPITRPRPPGKQFRRTHQQMVAELSRVPVLPRESQRHLKTIADLLNSGRALRPNLASLLCKMHSDWCRGW